jgi:hypothetical protein
MQTDIVDEIIRKITNRKDLDVFCSLNRHNFQFCRTYKNSIIKNMLVNSGVNYTNKSDNIYSFHRVDKTNYMIDGNYNFPKIYKELFLPLSEGRLYYVYNTTLSGEEVDEFIDVLGSIHVPIINIIPNNIITYGPVDMFQNLTFVRKKKEELDIETMNIIEFGSLM